jgi:hypothetical protein
MTRIRDGKPLHFPSALTVDSISVIEPPQEALPEIATSIHPYNLLLFVNA